MSTTPTQPRAQAPTRALKHTAPCAYCQRPLRCSDRARAENPFCGKCLHERMHIAVELRFRENISIAILCARRAARLTQAQLAQLTGLKQSAIAHFEASRREPSARNLKRLSIALRVSADTLLGIKPRRLCGRVVICDDGTQANCARSAS